MLWNGVSTAQGFLNQSPWARLDWVIARVLVQVQWWVPSEVITL